MSKQGMKRPEVSLAKNSVPPVPEIQGKAKHGNERANPIIAGTKPPAQKVWHTKPYSGGGLVDADKPISDVYAVIDSDLARDNVENDIPDADLQDL